MLPSLLLLVTVAFLLLCLVPPSISDTPARTLQLNYPMGLTFDADERLVISGTDPSRVWSSLVIVSVKTQPITLFTQFLIYAVSNAQGAYGVAVDPKSGEYMVATLQPNAYGTVLRMNNSGVIVAGYFKDADMNVEDIVIDDDGKWYVTASDNCSISVISPTGLLLNTWAVLPPRTATVLCLALTADRIYVTTTVGIFTMNRDGTNVQPLKVLTNDGPLLFGPQKLVADDNGKLIVVDRKYNQVLKIDPKSGRVIHNFTIENTYPTVYNQPWGVAIHPVTKQIYIADYNHNRVLVFNNPADPQYACGTTLSAGNHDLSRLTVNGADLAGMNKDYSALYFWSPCGAVQNADCLKLAPGASICGITRPKVQGIIVARPPSNATTWSNIPSPSVSAAANSTGVAGLVMNGQPCGVLGLSAALVVTLYCAPTQEALFIMDDSEATPNSRLCSYYLTLKTPVVCPAASIAPANETLVSA